MTWHLPRRRAARVVLLDPAGRVLLFHVDGGRDPDGGVGWYLPGGGMRPRETPEAAAARELREETGIRDVMLGGVIAERTGVRFVHRGREIVQDEWYVAGRVRSPSIGPGVGWGRAARRDVVNGHRWWTAADLAVTTEGVSPPDVPRLIGLAAEAVRR